MIAQNYHLFAIGVVHSKLFKILIVSVILLHAIVMALETFRVLRLGHEIYFQMVDETFIAIYMVELALRFLADPGIRFWRHRRNIFLFFLFLMDFAYILMMATVTVHNTTMITAILIFKSLRILRVFRIINLVYSFQLIFTCLYDTIKKYVLSLLLLLVLLLFLFGMAGLYLFGHFPIAKIHFGNLQTSMLSVLAYTTAENWKHIQNHLDKTERKWLARGYGVVIIIVGHYVLMNIVAAVIINNFTEAFFTYKEMRRLEKVKVLNEKKEAAIQKQRNDLQHLKKVQNVKNYKDFNSIMEEFHASLTHDDLSVLNDTYLSVIWMESLTVSLDFQMSTAVKIQNLHLQIFEILSEGKKEETEKYKSNV